MTTNGEGFLQGATDKVEQVGRSIGLLIAGLKDYAAHASRDGVSVEEKHRFGLSVQALRGLGEMAASGAGELSAVDLPAKRPELPEDPAVRRAVQILERQTVAQDFRAAEVGLSPSFLDENGAAINRYLRQTNPDVYFTRVPEVHGIQSDSFAVAADVTQR